SFPGCIIVEAASGKSAIEKMKSESFDIVLCDWHLPDINGCEILEWVRNESDAKDMPFMMITGDSDREHIAKAISLGGLWLYRQATRLREPVKTDQNSTEPKVALLFQEKHNCSYINFSNELKFYKAQANVQECI